MPKEYTSYYKKWWLRNIRERNFFGFRYWWFNWTVWTLSIFLLIYGIMFQTAQDDATCLNRNNLSRRVHDIDKQMEKCCSCNQENNRDESNHQDSLVEQDTIPRAPQQNCRVHFSGLFMGGNYRSNYISEIYKTDSYSEYVGSGFYPDNTKAFPNSVRETFDGIAVDKGTRLIIYSKKNFQGTVLLDITGPAVINNVFHINNPAVNFCNTINFPSHLQTNYPQSVRKWSESNMWEWSYGSCKIICAQ
jgi:hypothetical protein